MVLAAALPLRGSKQVVLQVLVLVASSAAAVVGVGRQGRRLAVWCCALRCGVNG